MVEYQDGKTFGRRHSRCGERDDVVERVDAGVHEVDEAHAPEALEGAPDRRDVGGGGGSGARGVAHAIAEGEGDDVGYTAYLEPCAGVDSGSVASVGK